MRPVFDGVLAQHGHLDVSPLELLQLLLRANPALAERLASHGLTLP